MIRTGKGRRYERESVGRLQVQGSSVISKGRRKRKKRKHREKRIKWQKNFIIIENFSKIRLCKTNKDDMSVLLIHYDLSLIAIQYTNNWYVSLNEGQNNFVIHCIPYKYNS